MSFQVNSSSFSAHSLILSAMLLYHLKDLIYVLHTKLLYNWISRQFVSMCGCFMYNNVPLNIPTYNFPTLKRTFQVHQHWIFLKHIVIHTYTHMNTNYIERMERRESVTTISTSKTISTTHRIRTISNFVQNLLKNLWWLLLMVRKALKFKNKSKFHY